MAGFGITEASKDANPIFPEGTFRFHIAKCESNESEKGKEGIFDLKVLDGPHMNKTKRFYFAFERHATDDKSVQAVAAGKAAISRISLACGIEQPDSETLTGKNFIGVIVHKGGWANLGECKKDTGSVTKPTKTEAASDSTTSKPAGW